MKKSTGDRRGQTWGPGEMIDIIELIIIDEVNNISYHVSDDLDAFEDQYISYNIFIQFKNKLICNVFLIIIFNHKFQYLSVYLI